MATSEGIGVGDLDRDGDDEVWFGPYFLFAETGDGMYVLDWEDGALVHRDWFDAPYLIDTWFGMLYQPFPDDPSLRWVAQMGSIPLQGFNPGLWWEDRDLMDMAPSFVRTDFTPEWAMFELVPPGAGGLQRDRLSGGWHAHLGAVDECHRRAPGCGRDDDGDLLLDDPTWGACFVVAYVSTHHGVFCPSEVVSLQDPSFGPLVVIADHTAEAGLEVPQVLPGTNFQPSHAHSSGWGVVVADLDADGHNDICIAHGEDEYYQRFPEHGSHQVQCGRNDGLARFDPLDSDDLG